QPHRRIAGGSSGRPGAGFAFEEPPRHVRHYQDHHRLRRRLGRPEARRGPSADSPDPWLLLLCFPSVHFLGSVSRAAWPAGKLRNAAHGGTRPAQRHGGGFPVSLPRKIERTYLNYADVKKLGEVPVFRYTIRRR